MVYNCFYFNSLPECHTKSTENAQNTEFRYSQVKKFFMSIHHRVLHLLSIISSFILIRWNAALVIQRNWRYQFYIRKQNYPKSSPSARNKRNKTWHGCYSYKNKHSHHEISRDNIRGRTICEHRGQSCALITRFLVDLRHGPLKMKFCFRGYIK